jgi:Zn-finger nucleic acid-binding protein
LSGQRRKSSKATRVRNSQARDIPEFSKQPVCASAWTARAELDNIFAERLWRLLKYEDVYIKDYETVQDAKDGIRKYFEYYNDERQHQSLGYRTPAEVFFSGVLKQTDLSYSRIKPSTTKLNFAILLSVICCLDNRE